MGDSRPKQRWLFGTKGWTVLAALLGVDGMLFLAEQVRWLPKGWPVLVAIAAVAAVILFFLLWFAIALVFRRRFQLSIQSLLALTLLVAVPCSWLAAERQRAKRQKKAVDAIVEGGGSVWYDYQIDPSGALAPSPQWPGPESLRALLGDDFFATATAACVTGNEGLAQLAQLPELEELDLNPESSPVFGVSRNWKVMAGSCRTLIPPNIVNDDPTASDSAGNVPLGVSKLDRSRFAKLRFVPGRLDLVSNASMLEFLRPVDGKPRYQPKRLSFTDAAFKNLCALTRLKVLNLECTNIGDRGLEDIQGLTRLRELYLFGSNITDAGVAKLEEALPNCVIDR
jgi:hypothetical protein